jgi:hypothetical protein
MPAVPAPTPVQTTRHNGVAIAHEADWPGWSLKLNRPSKKRKDNASAARWPAPRRGDVASADRSLDQPERVIQDFQVPLR